ncbi:MAG: hypothetical protein E7496_12070, partial [Ruminococcus sp.]|nr:hypothetical protein [Ruminococcus sp.]
MKQDALELLRNLFGNSGDVVWITDENWKIQWGRYDYSKIQNLPEMLNVPENLWEDASGQVFFCEVFYEYTIHCSKENKCRVIILKKTVLGQGMPEEVSVNAAVHSLRQVKKEFAQYFQKKNLHEKKELLDSLERNCLLLYRKPYILRMVNSVRNGMAEKTLFSVQDIIRQMEAEMQKKLGIYAKTVFSLPEKEIYLMENEEFFRMVVMAGLTLCHQERGYFHQAAFSLGVNGTKAELIINLTPDYQCRLNMSKQLDPENFGSTEEEKKALETFCIMHHGSWKHLNYNEENKLISSCCQICFQTDEYYPEI